MPLVSVVIPVYNIAPHLRQCLDSVMNQTLRELEIICVDDGSTDDSPKILAQYAAQDSRVRVIAQKNAGPGAARNTGMAKATGKYLVFLDSDDWIEPSMLEKMVRSADETGAEIVICKSVEFDTDTGKNRPSEWMLKTELLPGLEFEPKDIAEHIFQFTYGWPWDKLYRTDFVRRESLSYPRLPNSEDLVFVFQSLVLARKISVVNQVLVHHRVNRKSSVSNSRHRDPEVPYQALSQLKDALQQRVMFSQYKCSFLSWATEFMVWNVAQMGDKPTRKRYYKKLQKEWLPSLPFQYPVRRCLKNGAVYGKYILARHFPYCFFAAAVFVYETCKQSVLNQKTKNSAAASL